MDWIERTKYSYSPEEKVSWNYNDSLISGRVCGRASEGVLGGTWIIELDNPVEGYLYRCIPVPVPAWSLTPLEENVLLFNLEQEDDLDSKEVTTISLRLTKGQKQSLQTEAHKEKRNLSDYIRIKLGLL